MAVNKAPILEEISRCRTANLGPQEIVRKMFLLDGAFVFKDNTVLGFQILNSIAQKFRVSLTSVKIVGSSQTGYSPFKGSDFVVGESDLDIAIVNPWLFQRYAEIVYSATSGYRLQAFVSRHRVYGLWRVRVGCRVSVLECPACGSSSAFKLRGRILRVGAFKREMGSARAPRAPTGALAGQVRMWLAGRQPPHAGVPVLPQKELFHPVDS